MTIQEFRHEIIKGREFTGWHYDGDSLHDETYPYAMICLDFDESTLIAVGTDPLAPRAFLEQNAEKSFKVDFSISPRKMQTPKGYKTVYYATLVDTKQSDESLNLDFVFHSSDHLRFENGTHVSGPHGGAPRAIKVQPNINGDQGYTVTMFNTDGGQASIQMAPKQMMLVESDNQKIQLKGYGKDEFGAAFSDYGLTIHHKNGIIEKCILHMHDRKVDIEYLKNT